MDRFDEIKQRVKDATDLVSLLEGYLALRPRGRTLVALCPFHQERSPSFTVNRESQFYHCFGCGKSGDVFTWMMEREGYTFREAFEILADRAGIPMDGVFRSGPEKRGPDVAAALAEVRAFFQDQLDTAAGEEAMAYVQGRGLQDAVVPFGLGFHPSGGVLRAFAERRKLPAEALQQAGLVRDRGAEPLAGRLMFPIEDERGRTVAFGGRVLPAVEKRFEQEMGRKPAKYLNSPESPIFSKRRVLYGLHKVKQAGTRRIVVVEGYTDVIACHLAGFTGAVATLGTAFTQDHARVLERYATDGVVLLFDGDNAGEQAAQRATRELLESRLPVRVALMGDVRDDAEGVTFKDPGDALVARPGMDPALVADHRTAFARLLEQGEDAIAVYFRLLRKRLDLTQAVHLEAAARECAGMLEHVGSPLRREALVQEMARHLAVPPETLARMVRREARTGRPAAAPVPAEGASAATVAEYGDPGTGPADRPARLTPEQRADVELLACLLARPTLWEGLGEDGCSLPLVGELLVLGRSGLAQGRTATADLVRFLFTACTDRPDLARCLAVAADRAAAIKDPDAFFEQIQRDRTRVAAERGARRTRQLLQEAMARGDRAEVDRLTQQLVAEKRLGTARREEPAAAGPRPGPGAAATPPPAEHS